MNFRLHTFAQIAPLAASSLQPRAVSPWARTRTLRGLAFGVLLSSTAFASCAAQEGQPEVKPETPTTEPKGEEKPAAQADAIEAPPDVAAAPADATKTESGLAYRVLTPGKESGRHPTAEDTVEVHYTGWTTDGKMFDSSVKRGKPAKFPLNGVIKGWTEGVQLMKVGGKTRFWIPASLGYGETPSRPGAPAGTLVFDVELLSIDEPIVAPLDVKAPPKDATTTKSGLVYKMLNEGKPDGAKPSVDDRVSLHYTGWTTDGKMFESSHKRGQPADLPLAMAPPGWKEGIQLMKEGQKAMLWLTPKLAHGDTPPRPGAPEGTLVFELELVSIDKPVAAPDDVKAAPKDAIKTASGLSYKILSKSTKPDAKAPTADQTVEVHYTGWTTDGKMFDSSVKRGKPATFPLTGVIKGWTEGVQLMKVGEKARFWIPGALAYGDTPARPGAPAGTLVFDIELLSITQGAPSPH